MKSTSEDDVLKSVTSGIWQPTQRGNKKLASAYDGDSSIILLFSITGSNQFCGYAEMTSSLSSEIDPDMWDQTSKGNGHFKLKWIAVKNVPNHIFRHIRHDNKGTTPVTTCRGNLPGTSIICHFDTHKNNKLKQHVLSHFTL